MTYLWRGRFSHIFITTWILKEKCKLKTDNVEKCVVLCNVTNVSGIALLQCESIRPTVLLNVYITHSLKLTSVHFLRPFTAMSARLSSGEFSDRAATTVLLDAPKMVADFQTLCVFINKFDQVTERCITCSILINLLKSCNNCTALFKRLYFIEYEENKQQDPWHSHW